MEDDKFLDNYESRDSGSGNTGPKLPSHLSKNIILKLGICQTTYVAEGQRLSTQ